MPRPQGSGYRPTGHFRYTARYGNARKGGFKNVLESGPISGMTWSAGEMSFLDDLKAFVANVERDELDIRVATVAVLPETARRRLKLKKADPLFYGGMALRCIGSQRWRDTKALLREAEAQLETETRVTPGTPETADNAAGPENQNREEQMTPNVIVESVDLIGLSPSEQRVLGLMRVRSQTRQAAKAEESGDYETMYRLLRGARESLDAMVKQVSAMVISAEMEARP